MQNSTHMLFRKIRKKKGLTQKELADKLGVSETYVSFIENNKKTPGKNYINKFSREMDIPAWLFFYKEFPIGTKPSPIEKKLKEEVDGLLQRNYDSFVKEFLK